MDDRGLRAVLLGLLLLVGLVVLAHQVDRALPPVRRDGGPIEAYPDCARGETLAVRVTAEGARWECVR